MDSQQAQIPDIESLTVDNIAKQTAQDEAKKMQEKAVQKAAAAQAYSQAKAPPPSAFMPKPVSAPKPSAAQGQVQKMLIQDELRKKQEIEEEIEQMQIRDTLEIIGKYIEKWPESAHRIRPLPPKPTLGEVTQCLKSVRETRNRIGSENRVAGILSIAIASFEKWWGSGDKPWIPPEMRLDVRGITKNFAKKEFTEMNEIVEEIDLEYPWLGRQPLPARALGAFYLSMNEQDQRNKNPDYKAEMAALNKGAPVPIPEEFTQGFTTTKPNPF